MKTFNEIVKIDDNLAITTGMFDGVHSGHNHLLENFRIIADKNNCKTLIITFQNHPRWVINNSDFPPLLTTSEEKAKILEKKGIDYMISLDFNNYNGMLTLDYIDHLKQYLNFKVLLMGYNNTIGADKIKNPDIFDQYSKKYGFLTHFYTPYVVSDSRVSSTIIRNHLLNGDLKVANKYLGYSYFLSGTVVDGDKIGRTLGYPTANIKPLEKGKLIPRSGVYLCKIIIDNLKYYAITNIGTRPTINNLGKLSIEAYILDFNKTIYGEKVELVFLDRLRDEKFFKTKNELVAEIDNDIIRANSLIETNYERK